MTRFKWYRKLRGGIWWYNRYEQKGDSFPAVKFKWERDCKDFIFKEDYRTLKQIIDGK